MVLFFLKKGYFNLCQASAIPCFLNIIFINIYWFQVMVYEIKGSKKPTNVQLGRTHIIKLSHLICCKYASIKLCKPNFRTQRFLIMWRKHLFRTLPFLFFFLQCVWMFRLNTQVGSWKECFKILLWVLFHHNFGKPQADLKSKIYLLVQNKWS